MPENKAQDDDLVISLVELALAQPAQEREEYLRVACAGRTELFEQVWNYVQWEQRMGRFLLDPLIPSPQEEHHFESGELLDNRFRILREVAQGGMGIVYEARDEKLDRRIAIKCAKSGFRKRLPPEARHATEISHPNVCKIYEIHTAATAHGEIDFITMEFLQGETLADRLRRGSVPQEEALLICRQLCSGLAEAHRNQVIHGDLKSNNIILTTGAGGAVRAVITDFGLARRPETSELSLLSENEQGGTPDYMAPELWKGEKASVASDVYALGVLLYELATGHRPYGPGISWEQRRNQRPALTGIKLAGIKLDGVLERCLDPYPARRFSSAEQVAQALQPPATRRRLLALAAAAVLALGTGVVTYLRTATPRESIKLAVLPFDATPDTTSLAATLSENTATQLARLNGGPRVNFKAFGPSQALGKKVDTPEKAKASLGATHALQGSLEIRNGRTILHVYITDTRTQVHLNEWTAEYAPDELRYGPLALGGVVTGTFHLPATTQEVNAAAAKDYWAGLYYLRKNSTVDRALPLLEHAVSLDPDSPLTYAALAEAQYWKFTIDRDPMWLKRSAESVRQAELRNPDVAQVRRVAGLHKRQAGWYEQAAADYRRAIELDPANGDAYRRLGIVQEANSQMPEALASYLRAIELAPDDYRNHQDLGSYYDKQANYTEAIIHHRKAVMLAPEEPSTHAALGADYLNLGLLSDSEQEFRSSLTFGETPTALHSLGYTLIYQGKNKEAIPYIKQALARWPERYLWWMNLGIAYRRNHQLEDSRRANLRGQQLAAAEIEKNTRDGYVRSCLAYLWARLNKPDVAEYEIAQALRDAPKNAAVRFNAVATYEAVNRRDDSLAVLSESPTQVLADVSRFPDLADLAHDPRFQQLLALRQLK
jgi:serine/threonine protein kinase/tetratricopeptide (TPR) repeat protein